MLSCSFFFMIALAMVKNLNNTFFNQPSLNETMFPRGGCIGCGVANTKGFRLRIFNDPKNPCGLLGHVRAPEHGTGWPGVAHGGVLFTVLDCLSAWTALILRQDKNLLSVTRSAQIQYRRPAHPGEELFLNGIIKNEKGKNGLTTFGEIHNANHQILAELQADLALLKIATFKKLLGLKALPEDYQKHFPGQ